MRYQALLFSADEKASRVVSQILSELDFHVEACTEPFAAVKQITNEHYDALVVDCDDEQNAGLLFKAARNSNSNGDSLAVALVQGQGAIAKAFRIGANLILTKPINAEQSKGTLRKAKGLLRQAQAAKAAAAAASASHGSLAGEPANATEPSADIPMPLEPAASTLPVHPEFSAGAVPGALEQQAEEFPALGPAEAALIESMPEPLPAQASSAAAPQQQTIADESAAKSETSALAVSSAVSSASSTSGSAASAVAPAKELTPAKQDVSSEAAAEEKLSEKASTAPAHKKVVAEQSSAKPPSAEPSSAKPKPAVKPSPKLDPPKFAQLGGKNVAPRQTSNNRNLLIAAVLVLATAGAVYYAWPQLEPLLDRFPVMQKYLGLPQPQSQALVAPSQTAGANVTPAVSAQTPSSETNASASPQANTAGEQTNVAPALSADKASDSSSSSGASSQTVPQLAPDAAAALLLQKVDPTYPPSARQQGIQGPVQLQANIGKDGTTSNIKVLSGKPILATAAVAAVQQWKYQPYKVNGQPTEVQTQITVDFKLP